MTALVPLPSQQLKWGMTRDQLDLIKRTYADGTSDDEFALFMITAQRLELDVFAKQIYAVKRPTYDRDRREYVQKMTIQVGIDGFRATADKTGLNDGQDGPYWSGEDGVWVDAWLHDRPPSAAKVVVYKKGCSRPFTGIATYRSYVQTNKDSKANRQWEQMPDVMLAKCAEALALRKAFPSRLSGVYAPEEMGHAENDNTRRVDDTHAIDAEHRQLSSGGPNILDAIDMATSVAELESLVPQLTKLEAGPKARARLAYGERKKALSTVNGTEVRS